MSQLTFVPDNGGNIDVFWLGNLIGTLDKYYTNQALVSLAVAIQRQDEVLKDIINKPPK